LSTFFAHGHSNAAPATACGQSNCCMNNGGSGCSIN
jgi:hypothetical protein